MRWLGHYFMTTENHGKKIKEIWLPGNGNALDSCLKTGTHGDLELSATYHGDHDELWVLVKKEGVETERFNVRQLTNITWA